jgi:hypothetical protein
MNDLRLAGSQAAKHVLQDFVMFEHVALVPLPISDINISVWSQLMSQAGAKQLIGRP